MFNDDEAHELSTYLARKIFECGDDGPDARRKATRMQYKLGGRPERNGGGFIEPAMAAFIGRLLKAYRPAQETLPAHLRDAAPYKQCSACGRKTWDSETKALDLCNMPQPDGNRCSGFFREPV